MEERGMRWRDLTAPSGMSGGADGGAGVRSGAAAANYDDLGPTLQASMTSRERITTLRQLTSFADLEELVPVDNSPLHGAPLVGETMVTYLLRTNRNFINLLENNAQPSETRNEQDSLFDLLALLASITLAIKQVGAAVRRMTLPYGESDNPSKLNALANERWINCLLFSRTCCMLVSEDIEEPVAMEGAMQGRYVVVFDPLTGASQPHGQDKGAIFGVFRQLTRGRPCMDDVMQPGRQLIAAGYAMYGSSTILMFSVGAGLHGFTLDPIVNEFILTHESVRVPYSGYHYSINEGRSMYYDDRATEMLSRLKSEPSLSGHKRVLRYVGSFVPDVHRTILYGGVFLYPADGEMPHGRMKLLYEAAPIAFLVEQAGGQALTGLDPILDIAPSSIHDRVPVFLGSEDDTNFCTGFFRRFRPTDDPMFHLRRVVSIERHMQRLDTPARPEHDGRERAGAPRQAPDGIVCAYLPTT